MANKLKKTQQQLDDGVAVSFRYRAYCSNSATAPPNQEKALTLEVLFLR